MESGVYKDTEMSSDEKKPEGRGLNIKETPSRSFSKKDYTSKNEDMVKV